MADTGKIQVKKTWRKKLRGEAAGIACMGNRGPLIIAHRNRACHIVSGEGKVLKSIKFQAELLSVKRCPATGMFAVLDCGGGVHCFSAKGEAIWRRRFEGADKLEPGPNGKLLTNHPPYAIRYVDTRNDGGGVKELKCHCIPGSFALVKVDPLQIAVAGELGEIGVIDASGKYLWEFNMGIQTGPISYDYDLDMIVVPAQEDGIHIYSSAGETIETFSLPVPVTGAKIKNTPLGPLIAATADDNNSLLLLDAEGAVLWEEKVQRPVSGWDISEGAAWLAAATAADEIMTFSTGLSSDQTAVITTGKKLDKESKTRYVKGVALPEESRSAAPEPAEAHVFGELPLMGGLLPKGRDRLAVCPSGLRTAVFLPGGELVVMDLRAKIMVEARINAPARILQSATDDFFAIWNPERLVIISNENNRVSSVVFDSQVKSIDCSDDLQTIAFINASDELVVRTFQGEELCRKRLFPSPARLRVSPDGATILVEDDQLRFHFFDRSGNMIRKQKFGGNLPFDSLVSGNDHCAFASAKGPLIIQDMEGQVVFAGKINDGIREARSIDGKAVAVYENSGACRLMNWQGETIWKFEPPPGRSLIRMPAEGDPLLFQARRKSLVAYRGFKKQLSAIWMFKADGEIELFDADSKGRIVAVAAAGRISIVGPEEAV